MSRFIDEADRSQGTLLPAQLEEYVSEENPVRVIDAFVGELDLTRLGFEGMEPQATGRPGYHPATMLKIYLYGYLNRIQSTRRLEREAQRNLELMWTHFLSRTLPKVAAEMSLHVLAYNLKRVMRIMGNGPLIEALRA